MARGVYEYPYSYRRKCIYGCTCTVQPIRCCFRVAEKMVIQKRVSQSVGFPLDCLGHDDLDGTSRLNNSHVTSDGAEHSSRRRGNTRLRRQRNLGFFTSDQQCISQTRCTCGIQKRPLPVYFLLIMYPIGRPIEWRPLTVRLHTANPNCIQTSHAQDKRHVLR